MNTEKDVELAESATQKAIENSQNKDQGQDEFHERMINALQNFIMTSSQEEDSKLETLNKVLDKKDYYVAFYRKEFLEELKTKFFNRDEYYTEPEKRLKDIRMYVTDKTSKYEYYLDGINYEVKDEDDIEMFEKNDLANELLNDYLQEKKEVVKSVKTENTDDNKEKTKERFSSVLGLIEEQEEQEAEELKKKKEIEDQINNAPLSEKIKILYDKCVEKAIEKDGEEEGLIHTYVTDLYNPETTKLDEENLYFNLKVLDTLQSFNVIDFNFDTDFNEMSNDEFDLTLKHWDEIMNEDIKDQEKYFKILERTSKYGFYTAIVNGIAQDANKDKLSKRNLKYKNLFTDDEDSTSSMEQYLINTVKKKTTDGDIIMITPDMEEFIDIDKPNTEEILSNEHIKLLGTWKNRWVFVLTPDNFKATKNLKKAVFFIGTGNRYNINPEKPLAYYHVVDNPLLTKPKIKVFYNITMKFFMAKFNNYVC